MHFISGPSVVEPEGSSIIPQGQGSENMTCTVLVRVTDSIGTYADTTCDVLVSWYSCSVCIIITKANKNVEPLKFLPLDSTVKESCHIERCGNKMHQIVPKQDVVSIFTTVSGMGAGVQ